MVIAVVGLLDSGWLLYLHLTSGTCTAGTFFSCAVLSSEYATWLDIPIPVFSGLLYITVLAISLYCYRYPDKELRREVSGLYVISGLALLSTIVMATLSYIVLHKFCPFCFILYLISIGFFIVARRRWTRLKERGMTLLLADFQWLIRRPLAWVAVAAVVAILHSLQGFFAERPLLSSITVPMHAEELRSSGPATAKWVFTTFSDFQCPYCKVAAMAMRDLEHDLGNQVRVVYKFFPLDASCNPSGGRHPFSCAAARAAFCASLQYKFWPYHDLLFTSQEDLPGWKLQNFASEIGLDTKAFGSCMNDHASEKAVAEDIAEGMSLGIQGTPAIFINGRKYSGTINVPEIKQALTEP